MKAARLVVAAAALLASGSAVAADVLMHRDPGCGCCEKWVRQVQAAFRHSVRTIDDPQRAAFQKRHGVPQRLSSCHTAIIDGYVFEGHVPIADMKKLLSMRPAGVSGLAVAGMPLGSPGMEVPGGRADRYEVIAFGPAGERVFARH